MSRQGLVKRHEYSKWDLLPLSFIKKKEMQDCFRCCLVLSHRYVSWGIEERGMNSLKKELSGEIAGGKENKNIFLINGGLE